MQPPYDRIRYYKFDERRRVKLIAKLKALLAKDDRVKLAWLFGSLTRRNSVRDIDVAIHAEPKIEFREFLDLGAQIELGLGIPVDWWRYHKFPNPLEQIFSRTVFQ